jgi:hypothetical protein
MVNRRRPLSGPPGLTWASWTPRNCMASKSQGFDRPCHARPADRSLVAEDRSAEGVHDRTGPEPTGTRWVHEEPAGRGV